MDGRVEKDIVLRQIAVRMYAIQHKKQDKWLNEKLTGGVTDDGYCTGYYVCTSYTPEYIWCDVSSCLRMDTYYPTIKKETQQNCSSITWYNTNTCITIIKAYDADFFSVESEKTTWMDTAPSSGGSSSKQQRQKHDLIFVRGVHSNVVV